MLETALFFLLASTLGIAFLFYKKIPSLSQLSEIESEKGESLFLKIRKLCSKIKLPEFSWNAFLQKLLSKIRVLVIKMEAFIGKQLHFLRSNSVKKE